MLKPNSQTTTNLIKARELIADKKNWCRGAYRDGELVCAVGAIAKVYGVTAVNLPVYSKAYDALVGASRELFAANPEWVNDHQKHPAVMRMFTRAIELSLQEPGA